MLPFQSECVKSDKGDQTSGAASMWRKFDNLQPGVESTDGEFDRNLQDWEWHEKGKWKMTVSSSHVRAEHQVKLKGQLKTKEWFFPTHMLSNGTLISEVIKGAESWRRFKTETNSWKGNPFRAIK